MLESELIVVFPSVADGAELQVTRLSSSCYSSPSNTVKSVFFFVSAFLLLLVLQGRT